MLFYYSSKLYEVFQIISSECKNSLPILVKLLLSVDRSKGLEFAKQVIDLTIDYGVHKRSDVVVGLDVSGNMTGSNLVEFFPLLGKVKQAGLNLTGT